MLTNIFVEGVLEHPLPTVGMPVQESIDTPLSADILQLICCPEVSSVESLRRSVFL